MVVTHDNTLGKTVYINGVLFASGGVPTHAYIGGTYGEYYIGKYAYGDSMGIETYEYIKVYEGVLGASQVSMLYTEFTP